ncbi:2-keto-4-pentenoate hydratase [Emcibacter sp.]|uniref:2-keto-4-pentenoate hydratase n=1 Tax=Emcibacter sp. TaxID=1979954 RepID=UPI002AA91DF2|nr:fumarylacetoacetate hydrolase family protein [Emcibacter sp.]
MTEQNDIKKAALMLREAAEHKRPCRPLHEVLGRNDIETGYAIQNENTEYWLAQGRKPIGCKAGLTAPAVRKQLGVSQPDFGILFSDMAYCDGEDISLSSLLQPRIEGEIAFVLGQTLDDEKLTLADVFSAIDYAVCAIEVVDSRIADWNIRILDTVADNASSGVYVLGSEPRTLTDFDPRLCGMVIEHKGEPLATGAGAACLGNPLTAVHWLARTMAKVGRPLQKGDTLLSGSLGPLVNVGVGVYELRVNGLGSVRASFVNGERGA